MQKTVLYVLLGKPNISGPYFLLFGVSTKLYRVNHPCIAQIRENTDQKKLHNRTFFTQQKTRQNYLFVNSGKIRSHLSYVRIPLCWDESVSSDRLICLEQIRRRKNNIRIGN